MQIDGGKLKSGISHAADWLRWTERWIRPGRGPDWIIHHLSPVVGVPVLVLALIVAIPIPFGNIVPCLALMLLALGLIAEDGLALFMGLGVGLAAGMWTVFLFAAGSRLADSALSLSGFF